MAASTVTEYLAALPADRREALSEVRKRINRALPKGYEEGIQWGMMSWFVPLSTYPAGYGGDKKVALPLISLASMKNYMALHMVCFYGQPALRERFLADYAKSGKKLDMGQGCLRFKTLPDLPLDVIEKTIAKLPVKKYVEGYQAMREQKKSRK
jgi:uncharacterized protein YdhG (YjbR/CyaY superfamily)